MYPYHTESIQRVPEYFDMEAVTEGTYFDVVSGEHVFRNRGR